MKTNCFLRLLSFSTREKGTLAVRLRLINTCTIRSQRLASLFNVANSSLARKVFFLALLVFTTLYSTLKAQTAQFATAGTGKMRNYICWFDWAGRTVENNSSTTFTTADGLNVTVTFTNVSGPSVTPSVMNTWSGAVLWQLYDFVNTDIMPALFSRSTLSPVSFTMNITATRAGIAVPFTMVAADAEGSDNTESTTLTTTGTAWRTIEFFRNSNQTSNPLTGCGTKTVGLSLTYGGAPQTGQNPILATDATGALVVTTTMNRNVQGGMAVAFGIFSPIDRGDLPLSYLQAQHGLQFSTSNSCNYAPPFPSINQDSRLRLGSVAGDADGRQTLNDNTLGADEDAVSVFPLYSGNGSYDLSLNLNNTTGSAGYLTGWFDYNRDGSFASSESVSVTVPNGATSAVLSWIGLPSILPQGSGADFGFRFRLSSNEAEAQSPNGYAKDGEVEDYLVAKDNIVPLVTAVQAGFTTPDTVCIKTPVTITNTSVGASSYYWNFCVADINNTPPLGVNLGNPNGLLSMPVFMDYVQVGDNYYGFLTDLYPNRLVRLDFGNSLLNTPTAVNLGNFGGIIPVNVEGIQMVFNEGRWYAIIVGGSQKDGTGPRVLKVDFGADITNTAPAATNWGNIGGLTYPTDLHVFKEGNNWYGFTVNSEDNTIIRFDFTSSFNNTPTAVNLGNLGNLSYPTGIYIINDNGYWRGFIVNAGTNSRTSGTYSLTRLDFGSSLLNTPVGVNLGNPGNLLQHPRDLTIMRMCGQIVGFVVNGHANNSNTIKINFNNDLSAIPTMSSLGNIGNASFPHSISKLFRVKDNVYGFVTNVDNNTITRLQFSGCTNASVPNSSEKDPAPVVYNTPGTYNINLTVDDGLPTQGAFCRQVVVLPEPQKSATKEVFICPDGSVKIGSAVPNARYTWNTGATSDSIAVSTPGTYWIESERHGCSARDSFIVSHKTKPDVEIFNSDTTIYAGSTVQLRSTSVNGVFSWSPAASLSCSDCRDPMATPQTTTTYELNDGTGSCDYAQDRVTITVITPPPSCTNWLKLPSQPSYVRVGDLDIPGDKITVEATFNRTAPWTGVDLFQGDLVSKHEGPQDCNYLLRPGSAEITTSRGYFKTPTICNIELHKTYHVAMVYDGATLKFYRNGFLMSQVAASGNLFQNNWQTQIGLYYNQVTQENFIGYINEVRIWNIVRTQDEIRSFMDKSLPSPQATPGLLAYYTFDNLLNKQGNAAWNGTLGGNASVNGTNPNCDFVADSCGRKLCDNLVKPEFTSAQDPCAPNQVNFRTAVKNVKVYQWEFGNGQTGNASAGVATYAAYGNYPVKLKVAYENGCKDSVVKTVPVLLAFEPPLINTSDTTICSGDSLLLRASLPGSSYCWKEAGRSIVPSGAAVKVSPSATTTYSLHSMSMGNNLLPNGDFSSGSTGFSSEYTYGTSGIPEGVYFVGSDIKSWHYNMAACGDHTTGSGNMMMVNGARQQNVKVWTHTVSVTPHTTYAFSTWLQTITAIAPAQLQFSINGQLLDSVFTANAQSCIWEQFYATWNSGDNTSATISVVNMNVAFTGNDFALDDMFFGEVSMKTDTVKVMVASRPFISLGADRIICKDSTLQLSSNTAGGTAVTWVPALYLDNPASENPTAKPLQTVTYQAEVANASGCFARDTLIVTVLERPAIALIKDTTICQGESLQLNSKASNVTRFSWAAVGDGAVPVSATPVVSPGVATTYTLTAANDGCAVNGSVHVEVKPIPTAIVSDNQTVCTNQTVQLDASGGVAYEWLPAAGLSSSAVANPVATVTKDVKYYVTVKGVNGCAVTDSVELSIQPIPVFAVVPQSASICLGDTVVLTASGADSYQWSAASPVLSPNAGTTLAVPRQTTQYKVVVNSFACNIEDTLFATIQVHPRPVTSVTKSNDIDCSKFQTQLNASGGSSYEWFPAEGLTNAKVSNPVAAPSQTTTYQVVVTSAQGCATRDSITVKVDASGGARLYVPSAFTPNNDGKNDCFGVHYWGPVKDFTLDVYNRWGEKVFSAHNTSECWDGRYKGVLQPAGVFVYLLKGSTICGEVQKKGTVTLIR